MTLKVGDIIEFAGTCPMHTVDRRARIVREFDVGGYMLATLDGTVIKGRFPLAELDGYGWEIVEKGAI